MAVPYWRQGRERQDRSQAATACHPPGRTANRSRVEKNGAPDLVSTSQPPHREFDIAAGQLAPAFDRTHIGRLGIAIEEVAGPRPRLVARQREGLAQIAVVRLAPAGHPAREIARTRDHVVTPDHMTTGRI